MDIKKLILDKIKQNEQVRSAEIVKQTNFSRAYINRKLQELRNEGKIVLIGKANKAMYVLAEKNAIRKAKKQILKFGKIYKNENLKEDLVLAEIKKETGVFESLSENIVKILDFSFTEMLNNAIDHSQSDNISVSIKKQNDEIIFSILDFGVGIFNNIKNKFSLNSELEAIDTLFKGKQTTNPREHSGQGIFFTSKLADSLLIVSGYKIIRFINTLDDLFIQNSKHNICGTKILFFINVNSKRKPADIFNQYSNENYDFSKTNIQVKLFRIGKNLISRSEAKRLMIGLDKFEEIVLDFKDVDTIGQGFCDEVWRVWQNKYPKIKIKFVNANENVAFMIKRGIA